MHDGRAVHEHRRRPELALDARPRRLDRHAVAHVARVVRHALDRLRRRRDVQHRHVRAPQRVRLRDAAAQPARAARDHDHLVLGRDRPRRPVGEALVERDERVVGADGDGPVERVAEGGGGVGRRDGAEAEREEGGGERVEDGVGENAQNQVEGEGEVPGLGRRARRGHVDLGKADRWQRPDVLGVQYEKSGGGGTECPEAWRRPRTTLLGLKERHDA